MQPRSSNLLFLAMVFLTQAAAVVFYGVFHNHTLFATSENFANTAAQIFLYPKFMDIHIMVYIGMALLMAFYARFRLSALFQSFWVAALSVQYYFLWKALWTGAWGTYGRFYIATGDLIQAEFCAIAMLIAIGAIIGRATNLQLLLVVILGVFFYTLNETIVFQSVKMLDNGGSMYIFAYGGFYGLGLNALFSRFDKFAEKWIFARKNSAAFALFGCIFIWAYFPSFNVDIFQTTGVLLDNAAILNTYFGLIGSLLATVFTSTIFYNGKVSIYHILFSSISGGVLMGAGARILLEPFVAYIVGSLNGILVCAIYEFFDRKVAKGAMHETLGVLVFAISGFNGGWLSAIYRGRWLFDGGLQIAGLFISVGIALISGLVIGFILGIFRTQDANRDYFSDVDFIKFSDEDNDREYDGRKHLFHYYYKVANPRIFDH